MGITQRLGNRIPADVPFLDESGHKVTFANYLGQRPLIVLPIFYRCQTGCALLTEELTKTLMAADSPRGEMSFLGVKPVSAVGKEHPLALGKDMDIVMLSIDPKETPELATDKKSLILNTIFDSRHPDDPLFLAAQSHWHFLTGTLANIYKVTDAIGFHYYYNPDTGVIRHPTCSVIVSPNGTISSYTIGNEFPPKLLDDDLALAARNQVGPKADQTFMFGCLMLDPATGKIRLVVENVVRAGCALTLLVMCTSLFFMLRAERRTGGRLGTA
jgi:protein SCO1/2